MIQHQGEVENAVLKQDEQGRNFGFVQMKTHNSAEKAVKELNGSKVGGSCVIYEITKYSTINK